MIILESLLTLYTTVILVTTSIIEIVTGLNPREQLTHVQELRGLPETAGFADVLSSGGSR